MNIFYPHKGTREEALKGAIEYNTLDELAKIIHERYSPGNIEITPLGETDKDYTHIVLLSHSPVGYAFEEKAPDKKSTLLTQTQLDTLTCSDPACNCGKGERLFFHSKCHAGSGLAAYYEKGILTFTCKVCDKFICEVAVAEGKES